ncbi:proteophosphoglycan ppg4 [Rhodotorula toruloides]|uniref:Proteophosphoglycan ppg4 n=1 Tax=Rhodotorula toruloides TaxID=5286 RepID=A0A511KJM4_RHOTO|nr:proteophosphoglycan ppg4 [Rhodotorula toruloides]
MPLDLSHPRTLLPLAASSASTPGGIVSAGSKGIKGHAGSGPGGTGTTRKAIHLKLTEEVLVQLVELAKKAGSDAGGASGLKGALKVNLGANPVLVIGGISHALNMHPEAPDTELVRLSSASRQLEPVATIMQKGSVKHGLADLEKAGQRARENREQAEKEKEGRRAVLLDSAPSSSKNRSASHSRLLPSTSSRPRTPLPSSAPASRIASPSSTLRQPSRLTAVPPKPPHPPGPVPSSTFRIGKGTVPSSIALSRSSSSSSSGASVSLASIANGTAPSPPRPAASTSASTSLPLPPSPQRQTSTSSTASSSSSEVSLLQKTIASGASATSPESLPLAETAAKADKGKSVTTEEPETRIEEKPAAQVRAGGGGVLKGKESLRREERAKERSSAGDGRSSAAPTRSASAKRASGGAGAKVQPDDSEDEVVRRDKKKRRLLDDEDVGTSSSRASSVARSVKGPRNGREREASERGSGSEPVKVKKVDKDRRRQRDDTSPPRSNGTKKKKRQKVVTERWYSSSSSEEGESAKPLARKTSHEAVKPRASSTSTPLVNASPSRQVTTLPAQSRKLAPVPSLPPISVTSAASFASSRLSFLETYASYAVLHSKLLDERCRLERGDQGTLGGPDQVLKLVEQVGRTKAQLEALKEGIRIWSEGQKKAGGATG